MMNTSLLNIKVNYNIYTCYNLAINEKFRSSTFLNFTIIYLITFNCYYPMCLNMMTKIYYYKYNIIQKIIIKKNINGHFELQQ